MCAFVCVSFSCLQFVFFDMLVNIETDVVLILLLERTCSQCIL